MSDPKPTHMLRLIPRSMPGTVTFFGPQDLSILDGALLLEARLEKPLDPRDGKRGSMTARSSWSNQARKQRMTEPPAEASRPRHDLLARSERITGATVAEQLAAGDGPVIVDLRTAGERDSGIIAGSLHIPLNHLEERTAEIAADRPVVVHCQGGYRSAIAVSLLER